MVIFVLLITNMKKIALCILGFTILQSCNNEDSNGTRVYIEGKLITSLPTNEIGLNITSNQRIVAETSLNPNQSFVLSGPNLGGDISLVSNQKIQSFTTEKTGLKLSKDSLSILIPASISYLKFNEIKLKQ